MHGQPYQERRGSLVPASSRLNAVVPLSPEHQILFPLRWNVLESSCSHHLGLNISLLPPLLFIFLCVFFLSKFSPSCLWRSCMRSGLNQDRKLVHISFLLAGCLCLSRQLLLLLLQKRDQCDIVGRKRQPTSLCSSPGGDADKPTC